MPDAALSRKRQIVCFFGLRSGCEQDGAGPAGSCGDESRFLSGGAAGPEDRSPGSIVQDIVEPPGYAI